MRKTQEQETQQNVLYRLSEAEIKNPALVIHEFFQFCDDLRALKENLWQFLSGFFSSDYGGGLDKSDNSYYFFLFENLERLIEAAYLVNQKNQIKKKRTS